MSGTTSSVSWSLIISLAVVVLAGNAANAQNRPAVQAGNVRIQGIPDDWSHHRLVFSNPGSEADALSSGRHDQWLKAVNDPRFVLQQMKRNAYRPPPPVHFGEDEGQFKRDWAVSLGTGTVAQGSFPAKYTFNVEATPSCTADFAVYGLNVAGSTGHQANLVALNELYSGTEDDGACTGYAAAHYYWAYNATTHGGTITTSPVLSMNGAEVMYVESTSTGSYLHILEWYAANGGTPTASKAPTNTTETKLSSCPANASCLITVSLGTHSDTYSSPFYDYTNDIVYVGDDNGDLYKVTGVLTGAPTLTNTLAVSAGNKLTSPVYDATSGNVFVAGGTDLYAVKASTLTLQTHSSIQVGDSVTNCTNAFTGTVDLNGTLFDGPTVDSANGWVYEWVTTGSDNINTVVVQAHTEGTNSPSGTSWSAAATADVGQGDDGCDSSSNFPTWSPDFDNSYYTSITTGHMWICGRTTGGSNVQSEPQLWEIPTSTTTAGEVGEFGAPATNLTQINAAQHAQCSPLTEFDNGSDRLFFGEGLAGSVGDLYGFTLSGDTASTISGSPLTTYGDANGGTSGIVIDNVSTEAQASSIYFTTEVTGSGCTTGDYCAVKLTQSGLK